MLTVSTSWDSVPHQHASTCGCLEDIIHTLNFERGAFLVRAGTNHLGYSLPLFTSDPAVRVAGLKICGPKIGFAPYEDNGDRGATDRADFLYPLQEAKKIRRA